MTLSVQIDWSRNGTWTDVGDDVTDDVRGPIEVSYGREQITALTPATAGVGSLELDNMSRTYSPRNTASLLYGRLKPARPVRIQRTVGSTTYTIMHAHTDDAPISPDLDSRRVRLSLLDSLADFRGVTLSTPVYTGCRTGEAIGYILDEIGWTGGRDLDPGATFMPYWWAERVDALTALQDLVHSEGAPALLSVGSSGEIVFRDRHHRLLDTASLVVQGTWRGDESTEPTMGRGFSVDEAWRNVINNVTAAVDVRQAQSTAVVWTSDAWIDIADGETRNVTAQTTDPFINAITPTTTGDITVRSGTVAVALSRTSGQSTVISLTASGGPATITAMQLRAMPISVRYTDTVTAVDVVSRAEYGRRGYPVEIPWGTPENVAAVIGLAVAARAEPLPIATVPFQVGSGAPAGCIHAVLSRNLGDRVTIVEPETGLATDFYIEHISHVIRGEQDHVVTFGLEAAPASESTLFRFDTAGAGFNDGVFGSGLDDPDMIFIFDSAVSGHRFNEGVFAT